MVDRRDALKLALSSAAALAAPRAFAQAGKTSTRIVFLGTKGGPRVGIGASNPANLVVVNGTPFVIDCGMGVSRQLVAAGVPLETVKYIFISHHHSDQSRIWQPRLQRLGRRPFDADPLVRPKGPRGDDEDLFRIEQV
jgi:Metallo-beta-lactamase superfamily